MSALHDLQLWADALKASPLFPVALPVLLATGLAALADRIERHLKARWQVQESLQGLSRRGSGHDHPGMLPAFDAGSRQTESR